MPELEPGVIGSAYPAAGALDDRARDRAEPRSPVDPAFQHQIALACRVDADCPEGGDVVGFDLSRRHDNLDASSVEHRRRTHVHELAARHRANVPVETVDEP